jgi:AraC-like DNA-binding protein
MRLLPVQPHALPPTASGQIARMAIDRVVLEGIDPLPILHHAGLKLEEIRNIHARVDAEAQIAVLNLASDALKDDVIGFHLAERFELREAGLFYFVLASSATLGEAFSRAERYSVITNESIILRYVQESEVCIRYSYSGVPRHMDRHQMEFWVTALVRACQRLTGNVVKPVRVGIAHPRCASSVQIENYIGCPIVFSAEYDEVAFARGASKLRLKDEEPYLNDLLVHYCEQALSQHAFPVSSIRADVENAIAPLLPHGTARVAEVAQRLGMNRRTLARRLAGEGLTFSYLVEDMRRALALHYLKDARLSISQIAWLLGFQEVSAFTHAFKRWTGRTPTQMRRQDAAAERS